MKIHFSSGKRKSCLSIYRPCARAHTRGKQQQYQPPSCPRIHPLCSSRECRPRLDGYRYHFEGRLRRSFGKVEWESPRPVEHYSPPPLKTEHRRFSPTSLHISARGIRDSSRGPIELSRMAVTPASSDKCFQASWNNSEEWKCLVNFYHLSCTRFQIRVHY